MLNWIPFVANNSGHTNKGL